MTTSPVERTKLLSPNTLVDTLCEKAQVLLARNDIEGAETLASEASGYDPACNRAHQLLVRVALVRGEQDRAHTLLNRWRDLPLDDAFAEWGVLAEEMHDVQAAIEIYQAHLAQHPNNAQALLGLALLHADRNENALAQSLLQTLIQHHPDHVAGLFELARLYEQDEIMGLARELYDRVLDLDPRHEGARTGKQLVAAHLKSSEAFPSLENQPDVATQILTLFAGRDDVYARQWINEEGKTGYVPVREALTESVIQSHLRGDTTVGIYPVFDRHKAQFLAIDIDIKKEILHKALQNNALMDGVRTQVCKDLRRLSAGFASLNLPVYVEDSGYKGVHVWLFFAHPIDADALRRFGLAFLKRFGPPSEGLQWELFPKQDAVGDDELGNLIKLPLGIHRKTGRRAVFIDLEGRAIADQEGVLRDVKPIDAGLFDHAVSRLVGTDEQPHIPLEKADLETAFPEFQPLLQGCAVIRALAEKAFATRHLIHAERHVLKCVLGHFDNRGRAFLHAVIGACADYKAEVTDYQIERLHPHPISCPKIRKYLPELVETVPCNCDFALPEDGYPSPVLHIDPAFTAHKGRGNQSQNCDRIDKYVALRQQAAQVMADLAHAENEIHTLLRTGKGKISTGVWVVTADSEGRLQVEIADVGDRM